MDTHRKMKSIMIQTILLFFLVLSSTCYADPRVRPETWAQPIIGSNLQNLYLVDSGLYRSEQPKAEDREALVALGIEEVLNLRELHSDKDELADAPFMLNRVKIHTGDITEAQIIESLQIVQNRKGPILIHCWHGSDRTGVIIAAYRIVFANWSKAEAVDEMVHGGYGYHAKIYSELVPLVENLDVKKIKQALNGSDGL